MNCCRLRNIATAPPKTSKATADAVLDAGERVSGSMQIASTTTSTKEVDEDDDLSVREDDEKVVTY